MWFFGGIIFTSLAFITKVVYAPFLLLQITGLISIFSKHKKNFIKNGIILILPVIALICWQKYVDRYNLINNHIFYTSGNYNQFLWNVGTLKERFSYKAWGFRILEIIKSITILIIPLFVFGILRLFKKSTFRNSKFLLSWFLSFILYFLIFFKIQTHNYYFMLVLLLISIISAIGYCHLLNFRNTRRWQILASIYMTLFLILGSYSSLPLFKIDTKVRDDISFVKSNLKEKGNLIFIFKDQDWNSAYTYYTDRKGIVLGINEIDGSIIENRKDENFRYIAVFDIPKINDDSNLQFLREKYATAAKNERVEIFKI